MADINDVNIEYISKLTIPQELREKYKLDKNLQKFIHESRQTIQNILTGKDKRLLCIVGPCSIHNYNQALEYAHSLKQMKIKYKKSLFIVMRTYFEKPRTTVGWKGLINDPHLDGSYDINTGLRMARSLLLNLAREGMPTATELLDPVVPQYIADLISWTAIGARTTESQTHREMASGLSMPIGYKNSTDGSATIAINAMQAAAKPHHFLGINREGHASIVSTSGNPNGHLVLRGGNRGTNYHLEAIQESAAELTGAGLPDRLMVDCSHANSSKDFRRQSEVLKAVVSQVDQKSDHVMGVMIESHLVEGNQKLSADKSSLTYGQSVTDACISLETTGELLEELAASVARARFS